jgi:hypothetical protein
MELKKFIRYLGWELLLLGIFLLAVSSIPETVFSSSVARDAKQITLTFSGKHKPTAGTLFRLYCVAQESGDGLVVTEDFAGAGVSLALDADEWGGMATALEGYVLEQNTLYDEMLPNATALSDRSGKVEFPNLAEGVYLITGEEWNNGSYAFVPSASLVQLSGEDVSVTATYLTRNRTLPGEAITMEVVSIWNDGGNKNLRPQFVTVSLFCDGILYDQAILNEDNNWRHTWTKLTSPIRWS